MFSRILSCDPPRSTLLAVILALIFVGLLTAPYVFPTLQALSVAVKIMVFIVLVASFDILLGYTGIISFAHTMYFGIGAYGIAIASSWMGPTWTALLVGLAIALLVSCLIAGIIAIFSLRIRAVFFSMITLAVAAAFQTLAAQLSDFTGGEDGITFRLPQQLSAAFKYFDYPFSGSAAGFNGQLACYYLLFATCTLCFLTILRIVNSPFGRVLQAIRENEFRAEAIGYRVLLYRAVAALLSAVFATVAGAMLAIWLRYNGPETTLSFEIMIDVVLITMIGGVGTIYGSVIGSVVFLVAQNYLRDLLLSAEQFSASVPLLGRLLSPDRWLLWLGVLFVLSVYFFSSGIVGHLRERTRNQERSHK